MNKQRIFRTVTFVLAAALFVTTWVGVSAQEDFPLERCSRIAFSTEEDFMMTEGEPYDGNPYVSDGDLLSISGDVCARNADLLRAFDVRDDLGLDGSDILDFDKRLVAFSTELDSPLGTFTAGDILITNGAVIPNLALVLPFGISYNIGLDEVKFMGSIDAILRFVDVAASIREPNEWMDGRLQEMLREFNIDIWFSIEGTTFVQDRPILDGDLLAASGTVIATNRDLLHPTVPAGLPSDGVDFGLDAFAVPRSASVEDILERGQIYFSTEILYRSPRAISPTGAPLGGVSFTDGDVLRMRGSVVLTNEALIQAFGPRANFLGLDALWVGFRDRPRDPHIQTMCGASIGEFNGGLVAIGGPGTGLHEVPLASPPATVDILRQPCGAYVPIDGYLPLPLSGVTKFRVSYREASEPNPPDGTGAGIQTSWNLLGFNPVTGFCEINTTLSTDTDGWMDAVNFLEAKTGNDMNGDGVEYTDGCVNAELRLAVWDTFSLPAGTPAGEPVAGHDREDHYVIWLEWEDTGGTLHREPVEHHLQLDNTLPRIAPFPDGLQVRLTDGTTPVPACGAAPQGASQFQVWAQFDDRYYLDFNLNIKGGLPPATAGYGPHHYYDPDDGSGFKNTDDTGTLPDTTTVHVRDIDMTDLGESFTDCCYLLEMYVRDAAIRHQFIGSHIVNDNSGSYATYSFITFAAAP